MHKTNSAVCTAVCRAAGGRGAGGAPWLAPLRWSKLNLESIFFSFLVELIVMLILFHEGSGLGLHVRMGLVAWELLLLFPGKPL